MAEKNINTRIVHKHDTETNWNLATNFIPKQGEIIVYDIDDTHSYPRIKIGDGVTNVNDLPFAIDAKNETYVVTVSSIDGVAYTATVPGITELTTGINFIMVPNTVSTSTQPTLNVNGLGAKYIRRRLSGIATSPVSGQTVSWIAKDIPFRVVYDGIQWIVEGQNRPAASDLYGNVSVTKLGVSTDSTYAGKFLKVGNDGTVELQERVKSDWEATSGDAQILNKPVIPSKTSDLTNDSGFINTVDSALSDTSTNPVQNKVINTALNNKVDKSVVDNINGICYCTCDTAESTSDKVATIVFGSITLTAGARAIVKFTNANAQVYARLKVGSTAFKYIKRYDARGPEPNMWNPGATVGFVFDGTYWLMDNGTIASTTYYGVTKLSNSITSTDEFLAASSYAVKRVNDRVTALESQATTVSLSADGWTGEESPYSQSVEISGVTANSKVDLQPTATQIADLQDSETTLTTENDNGNVTVYAIGTKPTVDYNIQATITEVSV